MELKQIDVIRTEPLEAGLHRADEMKTGGPHIVRPLAAAKRRFGRNEHRVASSLDRVAEDLFRHSARVNIGGVEKIESVFQADIHESRRLWVPIVPPRPKKFALPAKSAGAEAEDGNFETGTAEESVFHDVFVG